MAATARHQTTDPSAEATAVPTTTGTTAAGSVRGRAPASQRFMPGKVVGMPKLVAVEAVGDDSFVPALLAAWERGDALLPVDPRLPRPAREALLASLRVGDDVEPGDALVVPTSGTTGEPKGVVLTHDAVRASALATSRRLNVDPHADQWLACLPLAHVGGLSVVTRSLVTGTPLSLLPGFDAEAVDRSSATLVSLVATALRRVDPSRWRVIVLGGSVPPDALPENVVTTYGMTETGSGVVYDGVPLDGVDVRVDDQIWLRGPTLLRCYRTATGEHDPKDSDGWFPTGDAGRFESDGRLHVDGRIGLLIITGGEKVWPEAVEAALRSDPAVADVAVAGEPDHEWGQRVVAFVVPVTPAQPPDLDRLRGTVKESLPAYCAPRELVLVDDLPRTALGKIKRPVGRPRPAREAGS